MSAAAREIGALWEEAALAHLRRAGLQPLTRNFICRVGEIDLVMLDKGGLDKSGPETGLRDAGVVFVEVRYRNADARGDGSATVGPAKRAKLTRAAALYLQAHPKLAAQPCRFDVIGCSGTPEQPQFDWVRNAFDAAC